MPEQHATDLLIVGAGPAGIAAAVAAHDGKQRITILDDNPQPGGQIWRGEAQTPSDTAAAEWLKRVRATNAQFIHGARIFAQTDDGALLAEMTNGETLSLRYQKLILATGARERFLPFPGWTLPNVFGAGGLQALVKGGLSIAGKRVVVAGTGPLLLAVAAYLKKRGAAVLLLAEQAPFTKLIGFGLQVARSVSKFKQALELKGQLRGVPQRFDCWPLAAHGEGKLARVTLRQGARTFDLACDYLACGFHLVPNVELAALLGCAVRDGCVAVDEFQQSAVAGVYCAGESTGIGGVEVALIEGQIAGLAASDRHHDARPLFAARAKAQRFAGALNRAVALRDELKQLPQADTLVCRCEDVSFERLQTQPEWRAAKLHTRCGMGPCQGRVCGPAVEYLFGWQSASVRPPAFPASIGSLAQVAASSSSNSGD
ncbi:MAG: NAD(P)/FAD-dependent oxidoreductase [Acidobacteria bacterium]|nr:NAD(P)/FAD-dependent oxidoreductase [Acidobacteriota bacterium]MBI3422390.1 NAD(P)/FAD-dependent oxidoreductase [Acidobacteriota bacterium]